MPVITALRKVTVTDPDVGIYYEQVKLQIVFRKYNPLLINVPICVLLLYLAIGKILISIKTISIR